MSTPTSKEGSEREPRSSSDDDGSIPPPPLDLPGNPRRLIAVGGGKGGVGKSLVAMSLAVYIAQLGKRVILVDADPTGANLHLALGVSRIDALERREREEREERAGRALDEDAARRDEEARRRQRAAREWDDDEDDEPRASRPSSPSSTRSSSIPSTSVGDREARSLEASLCETNVPGLRLLVAPIESSASGAIKTARKSRLLQGLRALSSPGQGVDVVIDVGPGVSAAACDLFLAADIGVLVTVPEPAAIETTYRFVRAMFVRDLRRTLRNDRTRLRTLDRLLGELVAMPMPIDLTRHLQRLDAPLGELAAQTLARMRPRLVVNQTRVRTDVELGAWIAQLAERRLGVAIDPLGHVEHDDAVWLANRRRKPLLIDGPSSKAARGLERVARRLLAVMPHRARELEARGEVRAAPTYYERLMIQRGASEEEVRRAHKRQREIYAADGLPIVSLFDDDELSHEHALLDEAYDVLLDPHRRRAYDVGAFPDHGAGPVAPSPTDRVLTEAMAAELLQMQSAVARELGPDTEFGGALLRRVRESRGIELREIATKTKVTLAHLAALEEEAFDQLPPLVYVRGFLIEVAKFLKLDPAQVARTYLRRAKDLLDLRR